MCLLYRPLFQLDWGFKEAQFGLHKNYPTATQSTEWNHSVHDNVQVTELSKIYIISLIVTIVDSMH